MVVVGFAGEAFPPLCVAAAAAPLTEDPPIAKKPKSEGAALVFGWANKGCDCPRCEKPPAAV